MKHSLLTPLRVGVVVLSNSAISVDDIGLHVVDSLVPLTKPPVERKEVAIDASLLSRYEGTYQLTPQLQLMVTVENGSLMIAATGQNKLRGRPYGEKDFFVPEAQAEFSFVLGDDGKATQLIFRQPGGQMVAQKVQ